MEIEFSGSYLEGEPYLFKQVKKEERSCDKCEHDCFFNSDKIRLPKEEKYSIAENCRNFIFNDYVTAEKGE